MRRLLLTVAVLCIVALTAVGVIFASRLAHVREPARMRRQLAQAPKDLAEQRAAARREGIPLEAADLKIPVPPPGQNAADCYKKVAGILRSKPLKLPTTKRSPETPYGYTPAQTQELRKILADRKDVLALIHRAAGIRSCVFLHNWPKGSNMMFPEFGPLRDDARLISAESYLLALDGHYEDAIANQSRGLEMARQVANDPTAVGYLVAIACYAIALRGMEDILGMAGPNPKVDEQVAQSISAHAVPLSLRRAMQGEFLTTAYTFKKLKVDGPDGISQLIQDPPASPQAAAKPMSAVDRKGFGLEVDFTEAEYLRRMRSAYAVADEHTQLSRDILTKACEITQGRNDTAVQVTSQIILTVLMPMFNPLERKQIDIHAEETVALAGAAILAAKGRTGVFPEHLPASYSDPFTGKPLGYRREGKDGFIVYSVGPKGKYDGKPGAKHGLEFFFRYPMNE